MPRHDDTPRDLLFGLLALQNGMVTRDQLVAAFGIWTGSPGRALADLLVDQGALDPAGRDLLVALAERHLRLHGGDPEKSLAALELNGSTRECLANAGGPDVEATLAHVGSGSASDGASDRTASYAVGIATSGGQRFRVLRPHARGGLGAVFVALDSELNREVALKQIVEDHADDPVSRTRFVAEAEITGGLEHPGIVPVYGLGSYGDGRPYYAMRFIRGDSLKEAIERFHSPGPSAATRVGGADRLRVTGAESASPHSKGAGASEGLEDPSPAGRKKGLGLRRLLRRFLDVCNAIEYAHSRGVLHRDIKPGNVVVGRHGETLVVDWGLAKPLGKVGPSPESGERTLRPTAASGCAETLPGQAMGTPAYMSPEQAAGDLDRLGPCSDVYSLGATLYCLLTGKAPFDGDVGVVLRKVQRGEFTPPRQINPSIDKALEAVCLKAMATNPGERYACCRELADDVERWMADESVSAWREPWARRVRRWARRNRPLVTAGAAAVLVALVGLGAVLAVQRQSNRALEAKNADLDRANTGLREAARQKDEANAALAEANTRVQARFELAREAIRSFKQVVEQEELLQEDRLRPLRNKLLGSARRFYDRLGELLRGQSDAASKAVLAESYTELGGLISQIGQKPEAAAAFAQAVAIRRELAATPKAGASTRVDLALALNDLGEVTGELGDHARALEAYDEARALAEPTAAGPGAEIEARRALGTARHRAGIALHATGKDGDALAAFRQSRRVREDLLRDDRAVPADRAALASTLTWIGNLLERSDDLVGALAEQRKFQELMSELADDHPEAPDYRRGLAASHSKIGDLLASTGDLAGALVEHRKDRELLRALNEEHREVPEYRRGLSVNHNRVGGLLERMGDRAGALAEFRTGQELLRALVAERPGFPVYRRELGVGHSRIGELLASTGDLAGALAEQRQCQDVFRVLADEHPDVPDYRRGLLFSHHRLGTLLEADGDLTGALAEYRKQQRLSRALVAEQSAVPDHRLTLAAGHEAVGKVLTTAGRPDEALAELKQAQTILEELARAAPDVPHYPDILILALNSAGDALRDLGRPGEARARHTEALAHAERLTSSYPGVQRYQVRLADSLRRLAWLGLEAGEAAGASSSAQRAVGLLEILPSADGRENWLLACARATLASAARRGGAGSSAAVGAGEAARAMDDLRRAAAMGYRNLAAYRHEPALAALRDRHDFKLLMLDLAMPAEPFAATR